MKIKSYVNGKLTQVFEGSTEEWFEINSGSSVLIKLTSALEQTSTIQTPIIDWSSIKNGDENKSVNRDLNVYIGVPLNPDSTLWEDMVRSYNDRCELLVWYSDNERYSVHYDGQYTILDNGMAHRMVQCNNVEEAYIALSRLICREYTSASYMDYMSDKFKNRISNVGNGWATPSKQTSVTLLDNGEYSVYHRGTRMTFHNIRTVATFLDDLNFDVEMVNGHNTATLISGGNRND